MIKLLRYVKLTTIVLVLIQSILFQQVLVGLVSTILASMNTNEPKSRSTILILNHLSLCLSYATLFVDLIKMVFVYDTYDAKPLNTQTEQLVTYINETSIKALTTTRQYSFQ
jgi:hypothetical protein